MLIVTILCIAAIFVNYMMHSTEDDGKSYQCFVAESVTADGKELTNQGVRKQFGLNSLADVMTVYLKDTGDCSIILQGKGELGIWSEEEDIITVDAVKEKIRLKRNFNRLIYTTDYKGEEIRFVLKKADKLPGIFRKNPELTYGLQYSQKSTTDLTNFMLGGQYVAANDTIYGKFFDLKQNGENTLLASSTVDSNNYEVIAKDGQAKYLSIYDGYLYYKWLPDKKGEESICRVSLEEGTPETLRTGSCDYVQVRFGKIYFTDEQHKFCVMTLEGKKQKVIIDKVCYMPYVIDRGWVIYQDDADGEKLHLATVNGLYDKAITDKRSYCWTIQGRVLYYTGTKEESEDARHKCKLYKMYIGNLEKMEDIDVKEGQGELGDVFAMNRMIICGGDGEYRTVVEWTKLANTLYDGSYFENSLMYLSDKYMITGQINESFVFNGITLKELKTGKTFDLLHRNN